jgi:sterol desaturase/sphingolipid hydroxylase (fatty acid hydroxylase superfamily)
MSEILYYAVPFFVLLLVVEAISFKHIRDDSLVGFEKRDTRTSLTLGLGNVIINVAWKAVVVLIFAFFYEITPLRMPADMWWTYVLLFFADDLAYYWFHRISHEVRVFWGSHVVHHSSEHFNLSTALRQTWVPMTYFPFWIPLALLGFPPWMILMQQSISLIYQFWIHTERIKKMPRWFEAIFNTPAHHRVHHGANQQYLDKNYAGILIIWDRLFGTFEPEGERVRYGLTKNIRTFNPVQAAFHEYIAIWRDVRGADNWHDRLGYMFGGPGWQPDGHDRRMDDLAERALAEKPLAPPTGTATATASVSAAVATPPHD